MDDVSKEVKRISNLRQNKNKDKAILEKIARINVWKKQISIGKQFSDEPSKIVADEIFNSYLNNYDFDSFTDVQNVADLVSEEVLKKQIQVKINKIASDENVKNVPDKLIASLHSIEERIWILKEKVGIASDKDKDALDGLVDLENKYKVYIPFNRNEFTTTCVVEDSLVTMSDLTTKKIQDIKPGDDILGLEKVNYSWKIKKQKVLNAWCNGIKEVIKIKAGNNELELTPNHRILAETGFQNQGTDIRYFEASKCWSRNVKVFNYIEILHDYYKGVLLGFIDSDGYSTQPIDKKHPDWKFTKKYGISQKVETKAVEWILNYFNLEYNKKWNCTGFKDGAYNFRISTKHTLFIDNINNDLFNKKDIQYGYLCGFLLGDGHRDVNNSWSIAQSYKVNPHKIAIIEEILNRNKITYTEHISHEDRKMLNINVGSCRIPLICPESKKLKTWYKHFTSCKPFYSLNKFKLKFVDIEKKKKVYDLTTETENFIANGFVVHNCSHCGKPLLLRRRCSKKDFETLKHPMFSGRFYYNRRAMSLVKAGILPKIIYAWIFFTSVRYVDWCLQNENKIVEINGVEESEIKSFIMDNPHLQETKIPGNILKEKK